MSQINQRALATFVQDDEELLADLASMFVQYLPDCAARLRIAVSHNDASMLRETSHQLKSRLGYFHAERLEQQALHLEQCGKLRQLTEAGVCVEELLNGIEEMLSELRMLTRLALQHSSDE